MKPELLDTLLHTLRLDGETVQIELHYGSAADLAAMLRAGVVIEPNAPAPYTVTGMERIAPLAISMAPALPDNPPPFSPEPPAFAPNLPPDVEPGEGEVPAKPARKRATPKATNEQVWEVQDFLKSHPNATVGQIGNATSLNDDAGRVLASMKARGLVTTTGKARGTRYSLATQAE